MTHPGDLIHNAEEKVDDLIHEAEEGESARTPAIALTGVMLVIAVAAAIMITVLFVLYYALK